MSALDLVIFALVLFGTPVLIYRASCRADADLPKPYRTPFHNLPNSRKVKP